MKMALNQIKYTLWRDRIVPILELSGWEKATDGEKTLMRNRDYGYQFEFKYYGNSAPVKISDPEPIG